MIRLILSLTLLAGCQAPKRAQTPPVFGTWFANANSINYLNLQNMALELRADSSYRYFYRVAPRPGETSGDEYTEGGSYSVRGDSLYFRTSEANGNDTQFEYARKYRMLSDTAEWPLRVTYVKQGVTFEVYFRAEQ